MKTVNYSVCIILVILFVGCEPVKYFYVRNNTNDNVKIEVYSNHLFDRHKPDSILFSNRIEEQLGMYNFDNFLQKVAVQKIDSCAYKINFNGKSTYLLEPVSISPVNRIVLKREETIDTLCFYNKKCIKSLKEIEGISIKRKGFWFETIIIDVFNLPHARSLPE